jgi:hypothetical protein
VRTVAVRRCCMGHDEDRSHELAPLTNEAPTSRLLVRALFVAVSTSALGGTRTANLLIRSFPYRRPSLFRSVRDLGVALRVVHASSVSNEVVRSGGSQNGSRPVTI